MGRPRSYSSACGLPKSYTRPTTEEAQGLVLAYTLSAPFEFHRTGTFKLAELVPEGTLAVLLWSPVGGSVMVSGKSMPTSGHLKHYVPRVFRATTGDVLDIWCAFATKPELPGVAWPLLPRTG